MTWRTAEGTFLVGGRCSSAGHRAFYTALDPAPAIVEVGVHKGFHTLDTVPHMLLQIKISDPALVHIVRVASIPDPEWLRLGTLSAGQQAFGDKLLGAHPLVLIPNAVSIHSWNKLIDANAASGAFKLHNSETFALDPRLNSAAGSA